MKVNNIIFMTRYIHSSLIEVYSTFYGRNIVYSKWKSIFKITQWIIQSQDINGFMEIFRTLFYIMHIEKIGRNRY